MIAKDGLSVSVMRVKSYVPINGKLRIQIAFVFTKQPNTKNINQDIMSNLDNGSQPIKNIIVNGVTAG